MTTPSTQKTKLGFRPHPSLLDTARHLYPLARTNTALFLACLDDTLLLPLKDRPSPDDLNQLNILVTKLEERFPLRSRTSKGNLALSNRYPLVSLYVTGNEKERLDSYQKTYPGFVTLNMIFRHALFSQLLLRGATTNELLKIFESYKPSTRATSPTRNPFSTFMIASDSNSQAPIVAEPQEQSPQPSEENTPDESQNPSPTTDDVLAIITDLITPPLEVPTQEHLTLLQELLSPGRTTPLFPIISWDYRPILERALSLSDGRLSSVLLRAIQG